MVGFLSQETVDNAANRKFVEYERLKKLEEPPYSVSISLSNAHSEIDEMESVGVQSGLVRSKHLQNLLQAATESQSIPNKNGDVTPD